MILAFETEELRTICEDMDAARKALGDEASEMLPARIADLRAADTIADLLVGQPTAEGDQDAFMKIHIVDGMVMTLVPNHYRTRVTSTGLTDWSRVTRVRLLQIGTPV